MECKICGREIKEKFYRHLNSSHKMKKGQYLTMFHEQKLEYKNQVPDVWSKGQTKETNKTIAKIAEDVARYSRQSHVRKARSDRMKNAYQEKGDILTPEDRKKVVKLASDAWVKRIKSCSFEERRKLLEPFTSAGIKKQREIRKNLTPEDYQRMFTFAKGNAQYGNCGFCKKQMIIWVGGKPRPKIRFCSKPCYTEYQKENPHYVFQSAGKPYHSSKMGCEFFLRSRLEFWFAELLDSENCVESWCSGPCCIKYRHQDKMKKYYPDFLVNEKFLVELKSGYIYSIDANKSEAKLKAGNRYCKSNNLVFMYWQFNQTNMSRNKFKMDDRVKSFFESIENDKP